jgi:phospholipid transport system transporter-binding protein
MSEASTIEIDAGHTARLGGPLTFASVSGLFGKMEQRLKGGATITQVDLAGVGAVDSAGLALLLEWQSRQRKRGAALTVHNAPDSLLRLARLAEADELLSLTGRGPE